MNYFDNMPASQTRPVYEQTKQSCPCAFQESAFTGKFHMATGKLMGSVAMDK